MGGEGWSAEGAALGKRRKCVQIAGVLKAPFMHLSMCVCVCVSERMHISTYVCVHMHMYACIYVFIFISICIDLPLLHIFNSRKKNISISHHIRP